MNQSSFTKPSTTTRIGALLAALAFTAILVGSQFAIADGYTTQADALMAARHLDATTKQAAASAPRGARS